MIETRFRCSGCHAKLAVRRHHQGKRVPCPRCGVFIKVPVQTLDPGATVGGYQVDHLLGHGTMGEVYLAHQASMNRHVALKVLPNADDTLLQYFRREVRTLAQCNHPNIVSAFEAGVERGVCFLAMSYVDGESLTERVERLGPLPEGEALQVVHQVAQALDYAWSHFRMLHRDVKPANIMMDRDRTVKLMDLGLACNMRDDRSQPLDAIGTPDFMAPEVIQHRPNLDFRLDLYALGATLYLLLTGRPPYGPGSVDQVLEEHLKAPVPDPRYAEPTISPSVAMLTMWMLAKEPADRPESWQAWFDGFDAVTRGDQPDQLRRFIHVPVPGPLPGEVDVPVGIRRPPKPEAPRTGTNKRKKIGRVTTRIDTGTFDRATSRPPTKTRLKTQAAPKFTRGTRGTSGPRDSDTDPGLAALEGALPAKPPREYPPWMWPLIGVTGGVVLLLIILAVLLAKFAV